jgi:hypothetical protein
MLLTKTSILPYFSIMIWILFLIESTSETSTVKNEWRIKERDEKAFVVRPISCPLLCVVMTVTPVTN